MKEKTVVLSGVFFFLWCLGFSYVSADEGAKAGAQPGELDRIMAADSTPVPKEGQEAAAQVPDWLKRTAYSVFVETDQKPRYYFETVQPLYQTDDKVTTLFTHDRISVQDGRGTYSAGFGLRRLMMDRKLLTGINTFFDYQSLHRHYRQGIGLEAITKTLEFRANGYFALSPKRVIEQSGADRIFERAANGGDVELGTPVPYLPWIKLFAGYSHYDFLRFQDLNGWKIRSEFKPLKCLTINYETYDDNKGGRAYRMDGRVTLSFDTLALSSIFANLKPATQAYPEYDLGDRALDRVERNFNIQVEKWSEGNGVVEIRRGN